MNIFCFIRSVDSSSLTGPYWIYSLSYSNIHKKHLWKYMPRVGFEEFSTQKNIVFYKLNLLERRQFKTNGSFYRDFFESDLDQKNMVVDPYENL